MNRDDYYGWWSIASILMMIGGTFGAVISIHDGSPIIGGACACVGVFGLHLAITTMLAEIGEKIVQEILDNLEEAE